jgi:hypothetical protein
MDAVDLIGAIVGGDFRMTNAQFSGELSFMGISVAGTLSMVAIKTDKPIILNYAKCRELNLSGASTKDIEIRCANVDDLLNMTGITVDGKLDMEMITVGGNLFLRDGAKFGLVYLWDAKIRGLIEASRAVFSELLDMNSVRAASICLQSGARFINGVKLTNAHVEQNVELAGGHFRGLVDLTGAEIGSAFTVSSAEQGVAKWDVEAELILQNASADTVQLGVPGEIATDNYWPERLQLNGFKYRKLSKLFSSASKRTQSGLRRTHPMARERQEAIQSATSTARRRVNRAGRLRRIGESPVCRPGAQAREFAGNSAARL